MTPITSTIVKMPTDRSFDASSIKSSNLPTQLSSEDAIQTDVVFLNKAIASVSDNAARAATCRNWRKCVIGDVQDESFIIRSIITNAACHGIYPVLSTPLSTSLIITVDRITVLLKQTMEEHREKILEAASDQFLDLAMELRLKTIGAGELVKLLAKADRLGYDKTDIIDDEEDVCPAQEACEDSRSSLEVITAPKPRDTIVGQLHRNSTASSHLTALEGGRAPKRLKTNDIQQGESV